MSSLGTLESEKGADIVQWIKEEVPEWDFSTTVLLTLRSEQFYAVLCSVGWLGGIPGVSPLDPGSYPPAVATKMSPDTAKCPLGVESPLGENCWVIAQPGFYFFSL